MGLLLMSLMPELTEGYMTLMIDNPNAIIWKSTSKGAENLILSGAGTKTWDLSNAEARNEFSSLCTGTVWVEGVGAGSCDVTLTYRPSSNRDDCSYRVKYTFISANCGRQPKTEGNVNERRFFERLFTNLIHCEWSIIGENTSRYNCIAWSVGEMSSWYVDVGTMKIHPTDIAIDEVWGNGDGVMTISELDAFYSAKGFVPTGTSAHDADIMYYSLFHSAKKGLAHVWSVRQPVFESKCGGSHRVEHVWDQLNGDTYGTPVRFYKHK